MPEGAVDLIARILREPPEPVAIAPIGPLTNIALLLRLHPELAPRIAHLCLMGGSIGEGNTTVSAEFNIYADPEAADDRVPVGPADHDDGPRRDPPGAAGPVARHGRLRGAGTRSARIAAELTDFALDRKMQWSGTTR